MHKTTSLDPSVLQILLGKLDPPPLHYKGGEKPSLLLVDDEPRLLKSLVELLKDAGYQLTTATNGREAIDCLGRKGFDVVLLDLIMPEENGHNVLDYIKESGIDVDVVVQSGCTDFEDAISLLKHQVSGYLRKPFQPEELLGTINHILERQRNENLDRYAAWLLESSEEFYRFLINSLPDFIFILNADGVFVFVNEQVSRLLGYGSEELIGKHFSQIVHEDDLSEACLVFDEHRVGGNSLNNIEFRVRANIAPKQKIVVQSAYLQVSCSSIGIYSQQKKDEGGRKYLGVYGIIRNITEQKEAERLANYQENHDILTGLPNRNLFRKKFNSLLIRAQENDTNIALMFIDLDRFKLINDAYGHTKGDELLCLVSRRMLENVGQADMLARVGGDEFILLLPGLQEQSAIKGFIDDFLENLSKPYYLGKTEIRISASIGIVFYPKDGRTMDRLIVNADTAMHQVKSKGKNGYGFYENNMLNRSGEKIIINHDLGDALEKSEFEMYFQPQIDVISGQIVGAEGLIRWNHPRKGLLGAGAFISDAEESGQVIPMTDWTIESVCKTLSHWNAENCQPRKISINLSPTYLERCDFSAKIQSALKRYQIPPAQIEIEILENANISDFEGIIEQLHELSQLGVKIAIDDFGTGYSSLTYLKKFPVHTIKLDQSFVKEIREGSTNSPIVLAIISIAHGLHLNLVAEGVETDFQSDYLKKEGCFLMQGYLYSKPLSWHQFTSLLKDDKRLLPDRREALM